MEWLETNRIQTLPPKNPKKLTGTRFAAVLGLNPWSTPFETWCEVTKTYNKPFEDTIYTLAGKAIEPKQAKYMEDNYFLTLVTPAKMFGADYFKTTRGDFFPKERVFGGMWDFLEVEDGETKAVLEMKTSKRVEDWAEDVPEYYALQAALYAYLLGVDKVIMVASFLSDVDYAKPEDFVCTVKNTIIRSFNVSERYPTFEHDYVKPAMKWWKEHVETGLSPEYDEKKDAEILKELRKTTISPETDLAELIKEAEDLQIKMDKIAAETSEDEKRLKLLKEQIKELSRKQLRPGDKEIIVHGDAFDWVTSKIVSVKIDEDLMKQDGVLDKYKTKVTETVKTVPKKRKD